MMPPAPPPPVDIVDIINIDGHEAHGGTRIRPLAQGHGQPQERAANGRAHFQHRLRLEVADQMPEDAPLVRRDRLRQSNEGEERIDLGARRPPVGLAIEREHVGDHGRRHVRNRAEGNGGRAAQQPGLPGASRRERRPRGQQQPHGLHRAARGADGPAVRHPLSR